MTSDPYTPTVLVNGVQTPKPIHDYNKNAKKLTSMKAKAMNILYCALERNKFNHISICINAHDI